MKIAFKSAIFAIIIVLALVFISVTSVFAAPMQGVINRNDADLEGKWRSQLTVLQKYEYLEQQIPKWIDVWSKSHHLHWQRAKKNMYANEIHLTMRKARILAANHPGFDINGKVTNKIQATQSVQTFASYLHQLHQVFHRKFHHS